MLKLNVPKLFVIGLLTSFFFFQDCKSDDEGAILSDPNPVALTIISNLTVADVGDAQNASDLQVSFSKLSDEANLNAYRIFVVESLESGNFDLEKAEGITSGNFHTINKTGSNISINLPANTKTISGASITNDVAYKIFVMSVSSDNTLYLNSLSTGSQEIVLSTEVINDQVKVTYIANDGIMIEFEDQKVVIDAINRTSNLGGWISPPAPSLTAIENGTPPYDDIDLILITHNHGDHYSTSAVQNYLTDHPNTKLIAPNSVEANFSAYASQIADFSVEKFERINIIENDISIDVLHIEHFDQFGNDFSLVESYAYIITMNDKKFLHAGDIDYIDSQLEVFNILDDNIDVVFIPTFGDLVSTANRDALIQNVDPVHIVCLHFLSSTLIATLAQVNNIYPNAETFTVPFETLEY